MYISGLEVRQTALQNAHTATMCGVHMVETMKSWSSSQTALRPHVRVGCACGNALAGIITSYKV